MLFPELVSISFEYFEETFLKNKARSPENIIESKNVLRIQMEWIVKDCSNISVQKNLKILRNIIKYLKRFFTLVIL